MKSMRILFVVLTAMFFLNGSLILAQDEDLNESASGHRIVPPSVKTYPGTNADLSNVYKSMQADPGKYIWGPYYNSDIPKNYNKFDPAVYMVRGVPCRLFLLAAYELGDVTDSFRKFLLYVDSAETNMENTGKPFSKLTQTVKLEDCVMDGLLPEIRYPGMSYSIAKTLTGDRDGFLSKTWQRGTVYYLRNGCSGQSEWAEVNAKASKHRLSIAVRYIPIINGDANNFNLNMGSIIYAWGYFNWFEFGEEWYCH